IPGIHLHLMRIQFLYFRRCAVPGGKRRITRGELGVARDHAELLLPRERLLAQLVPALVELAFVFVAPFLRYLVRRMSCSSRKVEKERFVRRLCFLIANPGNGVFHHRVVEIEILLLRHADDAVILCKDRIELSAFSAEKSPEIIEAKCVRPAVKRARRPLLRLRCQMPLADRSRVIAVTLKNLCDGRGAGRPVGAIAGPATDQLANRTESDCVMVSPRKQRCACWRTKRRDVESIVAKSLGR